MGKTGPPRGWDRPKASGGTLKSLIL